MIGWKLVLNLHLGLLGFYLDGVHWREGLRLRGLVQVACSIEATIIPTRKFQKIKDKSQGSKKEKTRGDGRIKYSVVI
jgi:hypothetical protein